MAWRSDGDVARDSLVRILSWNCLNDPYQRMHTEFRSLQGEEDEFKNDEKNPPNRNSRHEILPRGVDAPSRGSGTDPKDHIASGAPILGR
ncbi:hypothetical protein N7513_007076 [Penicillium frequentans]|nr:hypothetical protein N7513_007076 [Penicillium glabrum]